MSGPSFSRWTIPYFAAALGAFILAQGVMAAGWAYPGAGLAAPATLACVHLLTIGWLTLLMLGALHQFVPVIGGRPVAAGRPALWSLAAILAGLAGMEAGFLALDGVLPLAMRALLPAGGLLVLVGMALGAVPLARGLWAARPLPLPARFVLAGLGFLLGTAGLGIAFAMALACPVPWVGVLAPGLRVHVVGGLAGWFTLTAMGVSYRLLAMFMLAPDPPGRVGAWAFALSAGGLALAWVAGLAQALGAAVPEWLVLGGAGIAIAGIALYMRDIARLFASRRRRPLELYSLSAIAALAAFGASLLLAVGLALAGRLPELAGPVAYLFVFGWLSGLGLGQLTRIVPFLTWIQRCAPLAGRAPVPRVEDLLDARRAGPWLALYFAAVLGGTACGLFDQDEAWRLAIALHLTATLGIAAELWRARSRAPHGRAASTPIHSNRPAAADLR